MSRWIIFVTTGWLIAGCGSKCESYANKVADLGDPAPGRRETIVSHSRDRCERGRIPEGELACVQRASTRAQLIECTTGRPATSATDAAPAPKGGTAVTLLTAQNGDGFKPLDLALHEDQRQWFAGLKKDIAACATGEAFDPPKQYIIVVTFSPEAPAISLGGMPPPLSFCVKQVLSRRPPASVGNGPAELYIDVGR